MFWDLGLKKRFEELYYEDLNFGSIRIIEDKKTGIQYMITVGTGNIQGLAITPLLDKNGKPISSTDENNQ